MLGEDDAAGEVHGRRSEPPPTSPLVEGDGGGKVVDNVEDRHPAELGGVRYRMFEQPSGDAETPPLGVDEQSSDHRNPIGCELELAFGKGHDRCRRGVVQRNLTRDSSVDPSHPGRHGIAGSEKAHDIAVGQVGRIAVPGVDSRRDLGEDVEVAGLPRIDLHPCMLTDQRPACVRRRQSGARHLDMQLIDGQ